MNYELIIWLTGLMLFSYWLVYCMGQPLNRNIQDVDIRAILYGIPSSLTNRRLRHENLDEAMQDDLEQELMVTSGHKNRYRACLDARRNRLSLAREFFTWERSILCPTCLHFWLTLIFGAVCLIFDLVHARQDILLAGFTYLNNHFFIRKIS